jgi:hypothetical protein
MSVIFLTNYYFSDRRCHCRQRINFSHDDLVNLKINRSNLSEVHNYKYRICVCVFIRVSASAYINICVRWALAHTQMLGN